MLLTRAEMTYDFGGKRFDLERDRELLGWIFSQALFGEATGCYCGAALYTAPDIEAATFLSRQAVEEFAHFRQFLRIFRTLGVQPKPPHPLLRFLTSHEDLWDHHVFLEMALGEGFVLMVFYALCDTVDHPEIHKILEVVTRQEERHVNFGEEQAMRAIAARPSLRRQLLGQALVQFGALHALSRVVGRMTPKDHPMMSEIPGFLRKTIDTAELRMQRMGVLRPGESLSNLGKAQTARLVAEGALARRARLLVHRGKPAIPHGYLDDPVTRDYLRGAELDAASISVLADA